MIVYSNIVFNKKDGGAPICICNLMGLAGFKLIDQDMGSHEIDYVWLQFAKNVEASSIYSIITADQYSSIAKEAGPEMSIDFKQTKENN